MVARVSDVMVAEIGGVNKRPTARANPLVASALEKAIELTRRTAAITFSRSLLSLPGIARMKAVHFRHFARARSCEPRAPRIPLRADHYILSHRFATMEVKPWMPGRL